MTHLCHFGEVCHFGDVTPRRIDAIVCQFGEVCHFGGLLSKQPK